MRFFPPNPSSCHPPIINTLISWSIFPAPKKRYNRIAGFCRKTGGCKSLLVTILAGFRFLLLWSWSDALRAPEKFQNAR